MLPSDNVTQVGFSFASGTFDPNVEYEFVAFASNAAGEGLPGAFYNFNRIPGPPTIDVVDLVSGSLSLTVSPPDDIGTRGMPQVEST
jgi:hypothetical protein